MATHIKDVIGKFLIKKEEEYKEKEKIQQIVNRVLGVKNQQGIWLKGISGKEIIFGSSSSSLGYDFGLKKKKILAKVKKEFPQIKDIKIEVG